MKYIVIIVFVFGLCKLLQAVAKKASADEKQAAKEAAKVNYRYSAPQTKAIERTKAATEKELEREKTRAFKHEMLVRDCQYKMKVCETDYNNLKRKHKNLLELYEIESRNYESAINDAKKAVALRKLMSIDNQLDAIEKQERKIRYEWNTARKKMTA